MKLNDIIERLVSLGMPLPEARAYTHLSVLGRSSASEVAATSVSDRSETHRALTRLVKAGHAELTDTGPLRYQARPPEAVFHRLAERAAEKRARIESVREEVSSVLVTLRSTATPGVSAREFSVIRARASISRAILAEVHGATRHIDILSVGAESLFGTEELVDAIRARAAAGVSFRLLSGDTGAFPAQRLLGVPKIEARIIEGINELRLLLVDDARLVMAATPAANPPSAKESEVALVTDAPEFVRAQRLLFDGSWQRAVSAGTS